MEKWEREYAENLGCLFWGSVGTGKSYLAGCIANALMEKEIPVYMTKIPVYMTNFALILNDLIIDDFGMERGTEYGLEQFYNVIDSRYRSKKPLIVTTNLTLNELHHPQDTAHARIYDRLLEMRPPILFTGGNFRRKTAQSKLECLKELLNDGKENCL